MNISATQASSVRAAGQRGRRPAPQHQVVILDAAIGDRDSVRLVEAVRDLPPDIKVIVMRLPRAAEDVAAWVRRSVVPGGSVLPTRRMTVREGEVMTAIAEGFSNRDIASRLGIATYTVKSHVHNILAKLALRTRLEIAAYAHAAAARTTELDV